MMTYLSCTLNFYAYTNLLILCSGKAKVSNKAKKDKPVDEPILKEPALQTVVPEASATDRLLS